MYQFLSFLVLISPFGSILVINHINLNPEYNWILRLIGLLLQFIGILIVALQLNDKVFHLTGKGLVADFIDFIKRVLTFTSKQSISATISTETIEIKEHQLSGDVEPEIELEKVYEYLNNKINDLRNEVKELNQKQTKNLGKVKEELSGRIKVVDQELKHFKETINILNLSGTGLEVLGLVCLLIGVIYATLPEAFFYLAQLF